MYEPEKFVEKTLPKAGARIEGEVLDVKSGKLQDFVALDVIATWKNADPMSDAIEISARTDDGHLRKRVMVVPSDGIIHPKSNLAAWRKMYGGYPKLQQRIFLVADDEGFYQFAV